MNEAEQYRIRCFAYREATAGTPPFEAVILALWDTNTKILCQAQKIREIVTQVYALHKAQTGINYRKKHVGAIKYYYSKK